MVFCVFCILHFSHLSWYRFAYLCNPKIWTFICVLEETMWSVQCTLLTPPHNSQWCISLLNFLTQSMGRLSFKCLTLSLGLTMGSCSILLSMNEKHAIWWKSHNLHMAHITVFSANVVQMTLYHLSNGSFATCNKFKLIRNTE